MKRLTGIRSAICEIRRGARRSAGRGAGRQACHVGGLADRVIFGPARSLQAPSAGKTAGVASKTACSTAVLGLIFCASLLFAADGPRVEFIKSFPGSVPAYAGLWVDKTGKGEYKEAPADDQPVPIQLEASETAAIFDLAGKLNNFSEPLESGLKVAFTGEKTFRYQDGATKYEVKFNYSQNPDAQLLLDWFERVAATSRHVINLERTAKFDRLGLDNALLDVQAAFDANRLAGAHELLPMLDRIAKNKSAFIRVQERAASLAAAIRAGKKAPRQ